MTTKCVVLYCRLLEVVLSRPLTFECLVTIAKFSASFAKSPKEVFRFLILRSHVKQLRILIFKMYPVNPAWLHCLAVHNQMQKTLMNPCMKKIEVPPNYTSFYPNPLYPLVYQETQHHINALTPRNIYECPGHPSCTSNHPRPRRPFVRQRIQHRTNTPVPRNICGYSEPPNFTSNPSHKPSAVGEGIQNHTNVLAVRNIYERLGTSKYRSPKPFRIYEGTQHHINTPAAKNISGLSEPSNCTSNYPSPKPSSIDEGTQSHANTSAARNISELLEPPNCTSNYPSPKTSLVDEGTQPHISAPAARNIFGFAKPPNCTSYNSSAKPSLVDEGPQPHTSAPAARNISECSEPPNCTSNDSSPKPSSAGEQTHHTNTSAPGYISDDYSDSEDSESSKRSTATGECYRNRPRMPRPFKMFPMSPLPFTFDMLSNYNHLATPEETERNYEEFRMNILTNVTPDRKQFNVNMRRKQIHNQHITDPLYLEMRRKNNAAAKKSRDARKTKADEFAMRCAFLEQENIKLKAHLIAVEINIKRLRELVLRK